MDLGRGGDTRNSTSARVQLLEYPRDRHVGLVDPDQTKVALGPDFVDVEIPRDDDEASAGGRQMRGAATVGNEHGVRLRRLVQLRDSGHRPIFRPLEVSRDQNRQLGRGQASLAVRRWSQSRTRRSTSAPRTTRGE